MPGPGQVVRGTTDTRWRDNHQGPFANHSDKLPTTPGDPPLRGGRLAGAVGSAGAGVPLRPGVAWILWVLPWACSAFWPFLLPGF